jgi:hypothetical protein
MVKKLFILTLILCACSGINKLPEVSLNEKFVTLDKVKVIVNSQNYGKITLKGNVSIIRDSLLCFSLNGPVGFKALSGKLENHFALKDYFNDKLYNDIFEELQRKSGLVMNRNCFEYLLLGEVDNLHALMLNLNHEGINIKIEKSGRKQIFILAKDKLNIEYRFEFSFKRKVLHELGIFYKDSKESWQVYIDIISVSNRQKKCNFVF